eukprot:494750_1
MTTNQIKMPSSTETSTSSSSSSYNNNNNKNENKNKNKNKNTNSKPQCQPRAPSQPSSSNGQPPSNINDENKSASMSSYGTSTVYGIISAVGSAYGQYVAPYIPTYDNTDGQSQNNENNENNENEQQQKKQQKNGKNHHYPSNAQSNGHPSTSPPAQQQLQEATSSNSSIQYPLQSGDDTDASFSDLPEVLSSVEKDGIDTPWTKKMSQPLASSVQLRSITYKINGKKEKQTHKPFIFRLVHAQAFKTDFCIDNIAMHPSSWFAQNISLNDKSCFTIIVHLQVKSIKTSFITYH